MPCSPSLHPILYATPPYAAPPLHPSSGTKFFPGFVSDQRRAAIDEAALQWQEQGRRALRVLDQQVVEAATAPLLPPGGGRRIRREEHWRACCGVWGCVNGGTMCSCVKCCL